MPVTKATYTATATWTASQLADLFRDAFIDAGLMTNWFDSFTAAGYEQRVLEVTYDNSKTYGKTYYWFAFAGSAVLVALATGWNTSTDVPTGTQFLDAPRMTTDQPWATHHLLLAPGTGTAVSLVRYTSGVTPSHSWFVIRQGTSFATFGIARPEATRAPWLNLDRVIFNGLMRNICATSGFSASVTWGAPCRLRRDIFGYGMRGTTDQSAYGNYANQEVSGGYRYAVFGNNNNDYGNNANASGPQTVSIMLPLGFNNVNPAYTSDVNPVFHSMPYWSPLTSTLPSDFGVAFHYPNNTLQFEDKLIVSPSNEEWEVLNRANAGTANIGATSLFLARVVGD